MEYIDEGKRIDDTGREEKGKGRMGREGREENEGTP